MQVAFSYSELPIITNEYAAKRLFPMTNYMYFLYQLKCVIPPLKSYYV